MTTNMGNSGVRQFHNDMTAGTYGEYKIKTFLSEHFGDGMDYAEDKTKDSRYQQADIDLIVQYKSGAITPIEVKNDRSISGNIFYETISRSTPGQPDVPGCMLTTEAEVIFYMFENLDLTLVFDTHRLREWVNEYLRNGGYLEERTVQNQAYASVGYLIPVERLMGEHPAWAEVIGMRIFDLSSGEQLTYSDFEQRRLLVEAIHEDETAEPYTVRDEHWEVRNELLWEDNGVLHFATKSLSNTFATRITI